MRKQERISVYAWSQQHPSKVFLALFFNIFSRDCLSSGAVCAPLMHCQNIYTYIVMEMYMWNTQTSTHITAFSWLHLKVHLHGSWFSGSHKSFPMAPSQISILCSSRCTHHTCTHMHHECVCTMMSCCIYLWHEQILRVAVMSWQGILFLKAWLPVHDRQAVLMNYLVLFQQAQLSVVSACFATSSSIL